MYTLMHTFVNILKENVHFIFVAFYDNIMYNIKSVCVHYCFMVLLFVNNTFIITKCMPVLLGTYKTLRRRRRRVRNYVRLIDGDIHRPTDGNNFLTSDWK